jgi:hypothetical protein
VAKWLGGYADREIRKWDAYESAQSSKLEHCRSAALYDSKGTGASPLLCCGPDKEM